MSNRWGATALAVITMLGVAPCGDDDTDTSAVGSGSGSVSGSGVGACEPVGDGTGTRVGVTLDEWKVEPAAPSVAAGKVTFAVENQGHEPHELVVVRAASGAELTVVDGKVDEDALPDGSFIGEVEAFPAGESCEGTFELTAGSYVLFCNIVENEGGERESHVQHGMVTTLEVV